MFREILILNCAMYDSFSNLEYIKPQSEICAVKMMDHVGGPTKKCTPLNRGGNKAPY